MPLSNLQTANWGGPAKRLALRAAFRISRQPGSLGNPVLFWGSGSAGKSFLLRRIARSAERRGKKVLYLSFPRFAAAFRRELRGKNLENFFQQALEADFLLIDELEKTGDSPHTQAFLTTILDRRLGSSRQSVFASRLKPFEIPGIDPHLRNRLEGGFLLALSSTDAMKKDLSSISEAVSDRFGLSVSLLQCAGGHRAASARAAFVALALEAGFRGGEIANFLGGRTQAAVRHAKRRSRTLAASDPAFRAALESILVNLQ